MSSISLNGDTSGSIIVQAPAIAGSGTLTLPTGTATLATQGPAFRAYMSGSGTTYSLTSATWTKIPFNTTDFNVLNGFNTSTSVFNPTVAGYYQLNGNVNTGTSTSSGGYIYLGWYKNGSIYNYASSLRILSTAIASDTTITASTLVYLNGTTDYIELAVYMEGSSPTINRGSERANMTGFMVRSA